MKRFYFILLSFVCFSPTLLWADGNDALFDQGNSFYSAGNYKEAIESYEQILQTGQESPELFYNLGNSYFKTNQVSRAILNYERGLLLAPGDADIQYNLKIANGMITDRIEPLPKFFLTNWIAQIQALFPANSWSLFSLVSFAFMGVFALLFMVFRKRLWRKIALTTALSALVLSAVSVSFAISQGRLLNNRNTCVVMAPTVTIKSSPNESGTNLFVLHEGVKLQITDRISLWFEIKLPDGNMGWIPESAVEII